MDLNSEYKKVLVLVKVLQFHDMRNENRFLDTFRGHGKRTIAWQMSMAFFRVKSASRSRRSFIVWF